jgi:hypothetical protein
MESDSDYPFTVMLSKALHVGRERRLGEYVVEAFFDHWATGTNDQAAGPAASQNDILHAVTHEIGWGRHWAHPSHCETHIETLPSNPVEESEGPVLIHKSNHSGRRSGQSYRDRVEQGRGIDPTTTDSGQDLVEGNMQREVLDHYGTINVVSIERRDVTKSPLEEHVVLQVFLTEDVSREPGGANLFIAIVKHSRAIDCPAEPVVWVG